MTEKEPEEIRLLAAGAYLLKEIQNDSIDATGMVEDINYWIGLYERWLEKFKKQKEVGMTEKTRTCNTCCWGGQPKRRRGRYLCCRFNTPAYDQETGDGMFPTVEKDDWCRHWSGTTWWGDFKPWPTELEKKAAYILGIVREGGGAAAEEAAVWLEEYRRKC